MLFKNCTNSHHARGCERTRLILGFWSDGTKSKLSPQCKAGKNKNRRKCPHGKNKWNCDACGGVQRCEAHNRVKRSCRICYPHFWAMRILSSSRKEARERGYKAPNIEPENLLKLLESSPNCCGCNAPLDYGAIGFLAPCLHHSHETGKVIGFAHRECNALEGQLQKLGTRLPIFLKNFFPAQVN